MNISQVAITSCILTIGLVANVAATRAELNDTTLVQPVTRHAGYRSYQIDAVSLLFINGISGSVDLDFKRVSQRTDIGIRGGAEFYAVNGISGGNRNSPFADYFIYFRSSTSDTHLQWDLYAGLAYHTSIDSKTFDPGLGLKYGTDLRYYVIPHRLGIMMKLSIGAIGLGITFGNGRE